MMTCFRSGRPFRCSWMRSKICGSTTAAFTPAKGILMMFCNVLIICTMSIQGKGLSRGTPHDEMVESFGITWLLAGTSLGHIVGAGAILGCEAAGFLS